MSNIFKKMFCVSIAFAILTQGLLASAEFNQNDWQSVADSVNKNYGVEGEAPLVTMLSDMEGVTLSSGGSIENIDDPLYNYSLKAVKTSSQTTGIGFKKEFNLYNVEKRFAESEAETVSFSFMVEKADEKSSLYLYNGDTELASKTFAAICNEKWEIEVSDKKYEISAVSDENYITVTVSEPTKEVISDPNIMAVYDTSLGHLTIDAFIPSSVGKLVNVYLIDKANPYNIAYVEQGKMDKYNKILMDFKFIKNITDYKLVLVCGAERYEIENIGVIDSGAVERVALSAEIKDGILAATVVGNDAFYGVNEACRIINAYYKENDVLIGISVSDSWQAVLSEAIPVGTLKVKSFAVNSINKLTPYTAAQEITISE